jgi:hypothetical protein
MDVLFLGREGIPLYQTLLASETARAALRFYHPVEVPYGVIVRMASLGSALSLVSELRWYMRRYVRTVLFEIGSEIYCSLALATEVYYGRQIRLHAPWPYRFLYVIKDGAFAGVVPLDPESDPEHCRIDDRDADRVYEVWRSESEEPTVDERSAEHTLSDDDTV